MGVEEGSREAGGSSAEECGEGWWLRGALLVVEIGLSDHTVGGWADLGYQLVDDPLDPFLCPLFSDGPSLFFDLPVLCHPGPLEFEVGEWGEPLPGVGSVRGLPGFLRAFVGRVAL